MTRVSCNRLKYIDDYVVRNNIGVSVKYTTDDRYTWVNVPKTYLEATTFIITSHWKQAIEDEMNALWRIRLIN